MNIINNLKPEYVEQFCMAKVEEVAVAMAEDWGETLSIDCVDELHDFTIECIVDERLYNAMYAMLPVVYDDVELFLDELNDELGEEDVWGTYAMREGIGLCD